MKVKFAGFLKIRRKNLRFPKTCLSRTLDYLPMQKEEKQPIANIHTDSRKRARSGDILET
jgi:hypothetical protein